MKNETNTELNVQAFAVAGGITGVVLGLLMQGGMGMMYGGYPGIGMMSGIGGGFMGIWMGIILGLASGIFAIAYNGLLSRMK